MTVSRVGYVVSITNNRSPKVSDSTKSKGFVIDTDLLGAIVVSVTTNRLVRFLKTE